MVKPCKFYLPIYEMNYCFFIGMHQSKVQKFCEKLFNYNFEIQGERGKCVALEGNDFSICLVYVKDRRDLVALAHECIHAANFTLEKVGIEISTSNDEVQTYLFDTIFDQALRSQKTNR